MGVSILALTDLTCKNAKPQNKPYKLTDSEGLYLYVKPNGSKLWRLKYRYLKKEKLLSLGAYPYVSLLEARAGRLDAKKLLESNKDPSFQRRKQKLQGIRNAEQTFKIVALEWVEKQANIWSKKHKKNTERRLEIDIFPHIGPLPIAQIESLDVLALLQKIQERDALDLLVRVRQICGQVFRYGVQTGRCKDNPTIHLVGAMKTRRTKHYASLEPNEIPELLQALRINHNRLFPRTRRAILLSLLMFVRPGELRQAEWSEIDFEKNQWRIPADKMKARKEHIVPLSRQTVKILMEQKKEVEYLNTPFVFPSQVKPKKPMSNATVTSALHNLGFKDRMTAHGFRALARTAIREELEYEADIIEVQLAHMPAGTLGAAYDRTKFIKQRTKMMQAWADFIDKSFSQSQNSDLRVC